ADPICGPRAPRDDRFRPRLGRLAHARPDGHPDEALELPDSHGDCPDLLRIRHGKPKDPGVHRQRAALRDDRSAPTAPRRGRRFPVRGGGFSVIRNWTGPECIWLSADGKELVMETFLIPLWIGELARLLAAGALGAFAGAMLTEGLVLVPYWRSLTTER